MSSQNWYQLLGVDPGASTQDIEAAFATRFEACTDHNQRVVLRHAREVLCDPVARTAYDTRLRGGTTGRVSPTLTEPASGTRFRVAYWVLALLAGALAFWWGARSNGAKPTAPVRVNQVVPPSQQRPVMAVEGGVVSAASPAGPSPQAVYAAVAPSVVLIEAVGPGGQVSARGSGVAVGMQQVVTNCHVITQAVQIRVRQGDSEYIAMPGVSDTYLDLCMLQVPQFSGAAVQRASVRTLQVGQTVFAVGAPYGLERTLSQGLVSALRETADGTLIQTSAAISPGSSGGGLFNGQGQLVGITTFQTKSGQNLNFAVPVDWLDSMRTR